MRKRAKEIVERELEAVRKRLELYIDREETMLGKAGVESYSIGSRSLKRYSLELEDIQKMIERLQKREKELMAELSGMSRRCAVGVIPQDW